MLDIKYIRENKEEIIQNTKNRGSKADINKLLEIDEQRRKLVTKIDELRNKRNAGSKGKPSPEEIEEMKKTREKVGELDTELESIQASFNELLSQVPNLTHSAVKISDDEDDNPVLEQIGDVPKFNFKPLDHIELASKHDLIDLEKATEVSGAKFYYLKNEAAILEFALIQFAVNKLVKKGFTIFTTPDLARKEVLEGMGFNPRGESTQVYNIENSDMALIGTAEIPLGGYHMNETLKAEDLPKKYAAVSHCFRTEAGSYSKFSKGIFRVHQFSKIEMFAYATPEQAEEIHEELLEIEKEIFTELNIPFRVVDHCTADLGAPSIRTFDLEAWMPGKPNQDGGDGDWAEVTSTSNCTDYQSRALKIKYTEGAKKNFVYTLNGTAIAITRAIIAILENNQTEDGSINIPEALHKFMPEDMKIIKR